NKIAQIDGYAIHADCPDDGTANALDEGPAVVGVDARPPIAVPDPQRCDAGRALGAEPQAVADTLAGSQVKDPQRKRLEREDGHEAQLPISRPGRSHAIQPQAG